MYFRIVMLTLSAGLAVAADSTPGAAAIPQTRPNIVLVMADDLGFGDVAYNGNPTVKTPVLDQFARTGLRLDRFYAAGPVCTPTRASVLTGRSPNRYGLTWAGNFPLPREEITMAELLRAAGYRTGFFGKWHLGKLTPEGDEGFPGSKPEPHSYGGPWHQGFDTSFASESAVPTYNPEVWKEEWGSADPTRAYIMDRPIELGEGTLVGEPMPRWPYRFWHDERIPASGPLVGDSSELIVDHAVSFITESAKQGAPFLVVVWFSTPHSPIAAGPEFRALYSDLSIREQHWFGAISAMDAQFGRLMEALRQSGVEQDTFVSFCSDNGPSWVHELNSAGPLRGEKADVYEGGIRVPAVISWPAAIPGGRVVSAPLSTYDLLPTVAAAAGLSISELPVLDGENVLQLLQSDQVDRKQPIFFDYPRRALPTSTGPGSWIPGDDRQLAVIENEWKLVSMNRGESFELFNLGEEGGEWRDRSPNHQEKVARLSSALSRWQEDCAASLKGRDYKRTATRE